MRNKHTTYTRLKLPIVLSVNECMVSILDSDSCHGNWKMNTRAWSVCFRILRLQRLFLSSTDLLEPFPGVHIRLWCIRNTMPKADKTQSHLEILTIFKIHSFRRRRIWLCWWHFRHHFLLYERYKCNAFRCVTPSDSNIHIHQPLGLMMAYNKWHQDEIISIRNWKQRQECQKAEVLLFHDLGRA